MATKEELLAEARKRGLKVGAAPPRRDLEAEARRRGLLVESVRAKQAAEDEKVRAEAEAINPVLDTALGIGDIGGAMVTNSASQILGGLAGLFQALNPAASPGAGARAVADTSKWAESLPFMPKLEEGGGQVIQSVANRLPQSWKDAASAVEAGHGKLEEAALAKYGPLAATVVTAAPDALLEVVPGGAAVHQARRVARMADDVAAPSPPPTPDAAQESADIASELSRGRGARVSDRVMPDAEILQAAEELHVDLNPSHYSTNRAYQEVEQALKSQPGSKLSTVEQKAIADLGERADQLVADMDGNTDLALTDINVRSDLNKTIGALQGRSESLYAKVDKAIPRATRVDPVASRGHIQNKLDELGGDKSLLSTAERELLRIADKNPTYAGLDRIRKNIGAAIGRNKGPYKDDDSGILNQLYAVLSEDQQNVAQAFGVGKEYASARGLVAKRKEVEDQAITLFGREVEGSLIPKIKQATNALTKGDVSKLDQMMTAIPEARRQEVAATMLNNLFTYGARNNRSGLGQGFVNAFASLNRNPTAKAALFKYLPNEAKRRFNLIGAVSTGLFRAKALENTSGTARAILAGIENGGIVSKLYGAGKTAAAEGAATMVGSPGIGILGAVLRKGNTPRAEAADELLASSAFRDSVIAAGRGDAKAANRVTRTQTFKRWLTAQDQETRKDIIALGFMPWLLQQSPQPAQEQQ